MHRWSYAVAQHPMYLIIEEDEECAERTPPWGAPSIQAYIERWQRCLDAVDGRPDLRIGFETSGVELSRLAGRRPDIMKRMRGLAAGGRIGFYNGTWSQPHLQHFGAESNYRQLATGLAAYRELLGCHPKVHAAQEADTHEQLPQLLRAFGFRFAVPPGFFATLEFQGPHELVSLSGQGLRYVQGEELTEWAGLDGSTIPVYLPQLGPFSVEKEERAGLLRIPEIRLSAPDMVEIDDAWLEERSQGRFVVLDQALEERLRAAPPRSRVRMWSDWSYVEGIRAEELGRANRRAEAAALGAESLGALARLLVGRPAESTDDIWKTILTAQHHDAYCFCAPRLKEKAIGWLGEAALQAAGLISSAAGSIAEAVRTSALPDGSPVVVFNTNPAAAMGIARLALPAELAGDGVEVMDARGAVVPSLVADGRLHFQAGLPGLGYRSYVMRRAGGRPDPRELSGELEIRRPGYTAVVEPGGTFRSLLVGGKELLAPDMPGNSLGACLPDGSPLERATDGRATLLSSPLADVLVTSGRLGPRVRTRTEIWFPHGLPRIDVRLLLSFDNAVIGDFFDDESKLNLSWPLAFDGEIHHDIAFGTVRTRPGRPFFPVSWVDISDGQGGLAYFNTGTQRHRVVGRTLCNVLAWGNDTDRIGNRADSTPRPWPKRFDQRLRGSHCVEYALYPHLGAWAEAGVVDAARSHGTPLSAVPAGRHQGSLPVELNALTVGPSNVVVTAALPTEDGLRLRMYESAGRGTTPVFESGVLGLRGMQDLDGVPCTALGPFRICHAELSAAASG